MMAHVELQFLLPWEYSKEADSVAEVVEVAGSFSLLV
jgi:hypothetical protein